jgi:signal transduction histidine kinase/CheY-like chemotaxis protein
LHHQGKDFLLTVMLDITVRKELEEDLRRRVAFKELVVATSCSLFQAQEEELDALINHILQMFGEFTDVDRVYLFLIDPERTHMSNTHEWAAPGITPEKDNLQGIPLSAFPRWMDSLARRKLVHIPEVTALPDSWSVERETLAAQGIQSLLALPVFSEGQLLGFSGFDAVRSHREWTTDEQNLLQILSDNIGVAIRRFAQAQELRDASKRAVELAQEAKQANEAKSTFLANMSHEIRTPMNAILGFAQILNRDLSMSPEHQSNLQTIIHSGEHLLALLNDILDMSKIESGQTLCQHKPFALTELLRDVLDSLLPLAERKGLRLHLETISPLPQTVIGDQGKLRQVLVNLVGNAVKFTAQGEVLLRATANPTEEPSRRELRLEVCDTGPGIPADEIPKIFLPFQQAPDGVSAGGTGLGLPISRRFMEEMGGTLDVRSRVGHGSCFTCLVTIPIDTYPPLTARDNHEPISGIVTPHVSPKILVVDDVETNRTMVRLLLGPVGFEVFEAENGAEAVRSIERVRPDAVLMDMRMPVMDGYEATAAIRKLPSGTTLPIIAVTASAFDGDEEEIRAIGVDGYIRKPFSPEELFDTLGHLLSLRYRRRSPARPETTSSPEETAPPRQEDAPLSAALVAKMLAAIEDGDMETLRVLLNQAEDAAPDTTARLRSLSEQYDYDGLQATLVRERRTHE